MIRHYHISKSNEEVVVSSMTTTCFDCYASCTTQGKKIESCPEYGGERRQGALSLGGFKIFLCDKTKTTKLFKQKLEALALTASALNTIITDAVVDVKKSEQRRNRSLLHNLITINARSIQDMFFYDQSLNDAGTSRELINRLERQLESNLQQGAKFLVRVLKNNLLMKSEFSAFDKLERGKGAITKNTHHLRRVILRVLHAFSDEFASKDVTLEVLPSDAKLDFDYDSAQVAFVNIIDNMAKYTQPGTKVTIAVSIEVDCVVVSMSMTSLRIRSDEVGDIFKEGFSGESAVSSAKNGMGLGMWVAQRMMSLNEAEISFIPGTVTSIADDEFGKKCQFSNNTVVVRFSKQIQT